MRQAVAAGQKRTPGLCAGMEYDNKCDALGLLCPLPVLRARKVLKAMKAGQVLCLLADDPAAGLDVPHFCAEQGHIFLGQEPAPGGTNYFIRHK